MSHFVEYKNKEKTQSSSKETTLAAIADNNRRERNRSCWTRDWIARRPTMGHSVCAKIPVMRFV